MRFFAYLLVPVAILTGHAVAQEQSASTNAASCVDVQVGEDNSSHMNCVNEALKRAVEHEHNAPLPDVPISAQSASNKVGTYNDAAARQMMGNAFGVSAVPQRPKSSFTNPLLPAVH